MSICATIIARNEEAVITRCLNSVRPFVDSILLSDTGSSDATIEKARAFGAEVRQDRWRNFSFNRNVVLDAAREAGHEFALIVDADDILKGEGTLPREKDCYDIAIWNGTTRYYRPQLIRLSKPFHYRGVLHEFIEHKGEFTRSTLDGFSFTVGQDGARRKASNYLEDAYTLRQAIQSGDDPDLADRYTFYLAQSLRDGGEKKQAFAAYQKRTQMAGWREEVFFSHYQAGLLAEELKLPPIPHLMAAIDICPERAEPFWAAARYLNRRQSWATAWMFAQEAVSRTMPPGLFVNSWVYEIAAIDEFAIAAQRMGQKEKSRQACEHLLTLELSDEYRERIQKNLEFCL